MVEDLLVRLPADPMAVKTARGLVVDKLEESGRAHLAGDAALLVTELVSNAVMHARTAILLRVTVDLEWVRVAVDDGSAQLPVWSPSAPQALSGRGLTLVNVLASAWGADLLDEGGKTVWCELTENQPEPPDAGTAEELLQLWIDLEDGSADLGPGSEVVLDGVDPIALLAARDHSDDMVRECQLLLLNHEAHSSGAPVTPGVLALARRLDAAAEEFAEGRRQLRAAPLSALAGHQTRTAVRLWLTPGDANAATRYRETLDEMDDYCATGAMLTAPSTLQQRELRAWYLGDIARQLCPPR